MASSALNIRNALFLIASFAFFHAHGHYAGLALERCFSASDCLNPDRYSCKRGSEICHNGPKTCLCQLLQLATCRTSSQCRAGEVCFRMSSEHVFVCQSCAGAFKFLGNRARRAAGAAIIDGLTVNCLGRGVTWDVCQESAHCQAPRLCQNSVVDSRPCDPRDDKSICVCQEPSVLRPCDGCANCPEGEACYRTINGAICLSYSVYHALPRYPLVGEDPCRPAVLRNGSAPRKVRPLATPLGSPLALSSSSPPSPSPPVQARGACIAAKHLAAPARGSGAVCAQCVFRKHRAAQVLCDARGSCATGGHIVVYRGQAMRMATYCELDAVQCTGREMAVNSPRMRWALRVAAPTDGLEFTALAVRHNTRVEEQILRGLVQLGA